MLIAYNRWTGGVAQERLRLVPGEAEQIVLPLIQLSNPGHVRDAFDLSARDHVAQLAAWPID